MKKDNVEVSLRVSRELFDKISYIAEFEGRTRNAQVDYIIQNRIAAFENKHGEIILPDEDEK